MNILIFNWRDVKNSWAGGSELYIHELAKRWKKNGNQVTLITAEDSYKRLPVTDEIDGISVYRKGGRFSVYFWAPFIYLTKFRKNTDFIIDVENGIPFFTPLFTRKKKIALVYHVHGKQFFYELPFPLSFVGFLLEKYIFPLLYRNVPIMSISKSSKKELVRLGFQKSQITIITPGVEFKSFVRKAKYKRPTILYLGRIKKYKRLDLLMNIFPKVLDKVPNAKLVIAGWGTEAPQISDIVMKNGYRRNVALLGPVSEAEKRQLLQKSWIMVNPSMHEGWGISVTEANYYGTPAVAFKVPGLSDAIISGKTGFLCNNEEELIESIESIMLHKRMREKMSRKAQNWARTLTWQKAAKDSMKFIRKVN